MKRTMMACLLVAIILFGWGYRNAVADPVLRQLHYRTAKWPAGAPPLRIVLISDLHVEAHDTPSPRIAALVRRINALAPDCVLIAGDLTSDKLGHVGRRQVFTAVAPLAALRPRIGSYAVLGNHDYLDGPAHARDALARAGIRLLSNDAARCGPIAIGGIDDSVTHHGDIVHTRAATDRLGGVPIFLSHTPDVYYISNKPKNRWMTYSRAGIGLNLAGHTHCGQVVLPLIGPLATGSSFGSGFLCGVIADHRRTILVTAGIGTSRMPIRFNAPPDLWAITMGPVRAR